MAEFDRLHAGNSEVQEKQALAYQFAQTATVGLAATGVLGGLMVVQTATASGSVIIGAGAGVVGSTVGAGVSQAVNPGDVTFDVFTLNPVGGLPRNDIIVWDSVTKLLAVVVGTPNATPSDPTIANTKLPLARLRHAASATTIPLAKIDDIRVFTRSSGAPISVGSQAARDALGKYEGLEVWRSDLHLIETWNGTRWAGAPQTYSPAITGITSAGGISASYVERGKTVTGTIVFTLVAPLTVSGVVSFGLPFAALGPTTGLPADVIFWNATLGAPYVAGGVIIGSMVYVGGLGTGGLSTSPTPTTPFTWTTGSAMTVAFSITIA